MPRLGWVASMVVRPSGGGVGGRPKSRSIWYWKRNLQPCRRPTCLVVCALQNVVSMPSFGRKRPSGAFPWPQGELGVAPLRKTRHRAPLAWKRLGVTRPGALINGAAGVASGTLGVTAITPVARSAGKPSVGRSVVARYCGCHARRSIRIARSVSVRLAASATGITTFACTARSLLRNGTTAWPSGVFPVAASSMTRVGTAPGGIIGRAVFRRGVHRCGTGRSG